MKSIFGLELEDFWVRPYHTQLELFDELAAGEFAGVTIDAPPSVDLAAHGTVPVLACRFGPHADVESVDLWRHGLITAMDLGRNELRAGYAWAEGESGRERSAPPPPGPPRPGNAMQMKRLDLRRLAGLPGHSADYLVTVVLRERVSNRVRLRIEGLAQAAGTAALRIVPPEGAPLPSYAPLEDGPPLPSKPGLRLAVDRVTILAAGERCLLRGAFRLPVLPHEIVARGPDVEPDDALPPDVTAVVGITLLLTQADGASPTLLRLDVPSRAPLDRTSGQPAATGHFTLDLLDLPDFAPQPRTYFLYAFSGRFLQGPVPLALVSEQRLPQAPAGR